MTNKIDQRVEFRKQLVLQTEYSKREYCLGCGITPEGFDELITQTLQAERQKREELVEEERERIFAFIKDHYWDSLEKDKELLFTHLEHIKEALTQPNNPK